MKTSKDENWLTEGLTEIIYIKKLLGNIFDNYKRYWNEEVPEWDYEIREIQIDRELYTDYKIEIHCGMKLKVCILRQSSIISIDEFSKIPFEKFNLWNRVLIETGTSGAVKLYQDTVTLYRERRIESNGVPYRQLPLTISEAYIEKTNRKL